MKKILSLLAMLIAVQFSYAQTNTFPTSGSVGIGTTSPSTTLQITSSGTNGVVIGSTAYPSWMGSNGLYLDGQIKANGYLVSSGSNINWGASQAYVGGYNPTTGSNTYLYFGTAATERMRIDNSGNVGIGLTTPAERLDVSGNIKISTGSHIYNISDGVNTLIRTTRSDNTQEGLFRQNGWGDFSFSKSLGIGYDLTTSSPYGTGNLFIQGNVGIGTTSPAVKTEISDAGTTQIGLLRLNVTGSPTAGSGGAIEFGSQVNATNSFAIAKIGSYLQNGGNGHETGDMTFSTANDGTMGERMRLTTAGNVGIGTTDPQGHKLAVNGDIIATKITVKPYGNWPDYVFKPTYTLPSLSAVKNYIDQNQHLPDMPSEKDIAKDGVDLGEIVKLQTKKIEELTLYLIEKDNKDQAQQKEIDELKSLVSQLLKKQ